MMKRHGENLREGKRDRGKRRSDRETNREGKGQSKADRD